MPAEWEPHAGTWLAWPHNPETWPGHAIEEVETAYSAIVSGLIAGEAVHILVKDESARQRVERKLAAQILQSPGNIHFHLIPTNDSWIRDFGPNFIVRDTGSGKEIAMNKWGFNSWGKKYPWQLDDQSGDRISQALGLPTFHPGIVLEGGAIDVNGQGTCLTTDSCLLNPSRNGPVTREEMEQYLKNFLGVRQVIWLNAGLVGDDTDGHVDNLARFVSRDTIVCAVEENAADENYAGLQKLFSDLQGATGPDGRAFKVIPLPMPGPVIDDGVRLPASYANFYIGNRTLLLPTYNHENDDRVRQILQELFPSKIILPIPCTVLVAGLGGVHCLTQQQPA